MWIWESVCWCELWGKEVDQADLRRPVDMLLYLRDTVAVAIASKDKAVGVATAPAAGSGEAEAEGPEVAPVVVFVNSKSSGRHGPEVKVRLQDLMGEEQICRVEAQICKVGFPPLDQLGWYIVYKIDHQIEPKDDRKGSNVMRSRAMVKRCRTEIMSSLPHWRKH